MMTATPDERGVDRDMILCDTLREAAQFVIRADDHAMVFDHPGGDDIGHYAFAFGDEAREMVADGHVPYDEIETVVAAAMPRVPDSPPPE